MKVVVILGQTSTGKSDYAVQIAKKINGEIISADSRQVYKGMNLGTGKITKKEMNKIQHHLLDVVSPKTIFSVNIFQRKASKKIKEIISNNKVPIVCGGTGFYIDSIVNNQNYPNVKPNIVLRKKLDKKNTEELFSILKKLDKDRANNIDSNNKIRLIRAIEIAKELDKVPKINTTKNELEFIKIGLELPQDILKEKIKSRLLARIKNGMIKEVKNLHKNGISWKRLNNLGLEYRYISLYLRNKITKEEMIEQLNIKIWHYAKRQKTWWKRDKNIIWIDPRNKKNKTMILKEITSFLKK